MHAQPNIMGTVNIKEVNSIEKALSKDRDSKELVASIIKQNTYKDRQTLPDFKRIEVPPYDIFSPQKNAFPSHVIKCSSKEHLGECSP